MTQRIDIMDETAQRLAQLQALTGESVETLVDSALRARLAEVELGLIRAAIQVGIDEADAGLFTDKSVEELFEQGIAQARQSQAGHG
ncbi:hypothetical protein FBZ89_103279 [Nitrospirillum amazonense]|uniref:Uncharacterized protein n=1 Tax=Nitrospirillum amazonense TaxID=28077 RepID=A0A560FM07_9PROT|nr:hypothetical protein [Nitrospirillum amazonense]TWB22653.1 hypothetical protein FBZ89_103279 [Nitrospirillum amazonense]